jgi:hypothetical protein
MREWLLVIAPLEMVVYFLVFPDQLRIIVDWTISPSNWVTASIQ